MTAKAFRIPLKSLRKLKGIRVKVRGPWYSNTQKLAFEHSGCDQMRQPEILTVPGVHGLLLERWNIQTIEGLRCRKAI